MCGVFGFVGKRVDLPTLQRVAAATMARGPHAFGFAWVGDDGRLKMFKQTGRIVDHLGLLRMAEGSRLLIGHCRYATHGDPANNLNNHPHASDGGWIVHNGMIRDYRESIEQHELHPVTECDSEVLGLLIERGGGTLLERCVDSVRALEYQPLVMLGLWSRPARMVVVRQGNPLHFGQLPNGDIYLGSLERHLPGRVYRFKDDSAREITKKGVHCVSLSA